LVFVCEETAVDMYRGASDEEEDGMCVWEYRGYDFPRCCVEREGRESRLRTRPGCSRPLTQRRKFCLAALVIVNVTIGSARRYNAIPTLPGLALVAVRNSCAQTRVAPERKRYEPAGRRHTPSVCARAMVQASGAIPFAF